LEFYIVTLTQKKTQ